jgi:transcriptional regulator with XRE-family HTH domain
VRGLSAVSLHLQHGLGRAIRQRREALGLTQDELGARIGIGRTRVSRVESGKHCLMLGTVELYARGLDCRASELVADAERLGRNSMLEEAAE